MGKFSFKHCGLVALGYLALGFAGCWLALPPGYASPVWPAAGFAVSSLLLYGKRCWLGVFVASLLLNLWLTFRATGIPGNILPLCVMAGGAALQAYIGAVLGQRFLDASNPFARQRDTFAFLLLTGPFSCLIASTIGISTLAMDHRIPQGSFLLQWMAWWAGDSVGVILLIPFAFVIHARQQHNNAVHLSALSLPLALILFSLIALLVWAEVHTTSTNLLYLQIICVLFSLLLVMTVLNSAGRVAAISAEVAQRKQAEEKLRETNRILLEKEQQANHAQRLQAIGTLAGGIAHDINNSLTPIILLMDILKEEFPGKQQHLLLIEKSASHAAEMVRQLLMFAKGAEVKRAPLDVATLLDDLDKLLQSTFPKNIGCVVRIAPDLPAVLGDRTQLNQVLLNLCVNARDAMPQGGSMLVTAQADEVQRFPGVLVTDGTPGTYVRIDVTDTGPGIAEEMLTRIFDPFFTTKGSEKGTGLGLSTVVGIMRSHQGQVTVRSGPGQGTTFSIYLPTNNQPTATASVAAPVASTPTGKTVLLVDDEPPVLELGAAVLQQAGYRVLCAQHALDALDQLKHHPEIDLLITDFHMPGIDGLELVRRIRPLHPELQIVVASGLLDDATAEQFGQLGVTRRLDKPFNRHSLLNMLATTS